MSKLARLPQGPQAKCNQCKKTWLLFCLESKSQICIAWNFACTPYACIYQAKQGTSANELSYIMQFWEFHITSDPSFTIIMAMIETKESIPHTAILAPRINRRQSLATYNFISFTCPSLRDLPFAPEYS